MGKANGSGTPVLQADENVKTPGTQTTFFREGVPDNIIRIALMQGNTRDETVIHFREDATPDFDSHADAKKLANGIFNLSTQILDGTKLAINSHAPLDCRAVINLVIENVTPGNYNLAFTELPSFPDGTQVQLQDNFLNHTLHVENEINYAFHVTDNPTSFGAGRFVVIITEAPRSTPIHIEHNTLSVRFTDGIQWYYNGEAIAGATGASFEATESGVYEVRISANGCSYFGKTELLITGIESNLSAIQVYPNPVKDELIFEFPGANQSTTILLHNMVGQVCGSAEFLRTGTLNMSELPAGFYTLKFTTGNQVITKKIIKQ